MSLGLLETERREHVQLVERACAHAATFEHLVLIKTCYLALLYPHHWTLRRFTHGHDVSLRV